MPAPLSSMRAEYGAWASDTGCGPFDETNYLQLVKGPRNNFVRHAAI
jgi:hypothetical protein